MKEKIQALIRCAEDEITISDSIIDDALRKVKSVRELPEGDPAYEALAKYGHVHDYCRGRISAFKQVIAMLGE